MTIPTLLAFLAGAIAFAIRWLQQLRASQYDAQELEIPATVIKDKLIFRLSWGALAALVIGYIIGGHYHLPISVIAGPIALLMVLVVQFRRVRKATSLLLSAPWHILIYALGMFVVITAAFNAQVLEVLTTPLRGFVAQDQSAFPALAAGSLLALLSALVNNLPATLIGVLVLRTAPQVSLIAIYAIILGVDIGPKLTPFGSLATLLWLGILQKYGIRISWGTYLRENWWVTLIVFAAALVGLLISHLLFAS
jgi:arsenical pump membrane protein